MGSVSTRDGRRENRRLIGFARLGRKGVFS